MGLTKVTKKLKSETKKLIGGTRLKISKPQAKELLKEAQDSSSQNRTKEKSDDVKTLVKTNALQPGTSQPDIDYQKMYFALLAEHENLKKEHEALKTVMFGENGKFRFLEVNVNQESTN